MKTSTIHEWNERIGAFTGFIFGVGAGCVLVLAIIAVWGWL